MSKMAGEGLEKPTPLRKRDLLKLEIETNKRFSLLAYLGEIVCGAFGSFGAYNSLDGKIDGLVIVGFGGYALARYVNNCIYTRQGILENLLEDTEDKSKSLEDK